jgi:hypothetical protein
MEIPFAPTQGLARKLATRAWFVNSAGEAIRTGTPEPLTNPETRNPKPETRNPKPETRNPNT